MRKYTGKPFIIASTTLIGTGAAFAAVGASGQPAFGYASIGLLVPGVLLLLLAGLRTMVRRP